MLTRIRAFFRRRELDSDFDLELESHLAMLAEDYSRRGMPPEEARRAARVALGGRTQLREAHRETRGLALLEACRQDVQYATRALGKSPGFTAIAVLTLGIGIGVNAAVFTAYNGIVLRPIQAEDPSRLVQVTRSRDDFFSYPDYAYYRDGNRSFSGLAAITAGRTFSIGGAGTPALEEHSALASAAGLKFPMALAGSSEQVGGHGLSENYFQVLGVGAVLGRTFLPEDGTAGAEPVVLASYNFWQRRFSCDPGLLGRKLKLDGVAVTIVGITPRDFTGTLPTIPDLWLPLTLYSRLSSNVDFLQDRNSACCRVYGRLRPGVVPGQAAAEVNALAAHLPLAIPDADSPSGKHPGRFVLTQASPSGPDNAAIALGIVILTPVSLILFIACANVASLLLARSAARQREIAIRLAIGASRNRLIRQLLTENAVMNLLAGAAGIVLSWWLMHLLTVQIAASLPGYLLMPLHAAPDGRVLAYTLFLSITATLACGLAPALEASRPNLTSALKDEGAAFGGRLRKSRLRDLMIGMQVAVCLVLLIAAGMLARTSHRALAVDLGFDYRNMVFLGVGGFPRGTAPAKVAAIRAQLLQHLEGLPEIQAVAVASRMPLAGGVSTIAVGLNGRAPNERGAPNAVFDLVTPNYFATLGIPIVRGRHFTSQEARDSFNFDGSPVIVSEATASRFWPGEDPVGKRITAGPPSRRRIFAGQQYPRSAGSVVIGVAKDVRSVDLYRVDETCLYFPVTGTWTGAFLMRARGEETKAVAAVEREFHTHHADLEAEVLDSRTAFTNQGAFVASRLGAIGAAIIGVLGLLMASVGIHGTVGFAVARRTQEIGIRMALGARRGDVLRLMLWETMRPVAIGLAVGFGVSAIVSRLMSFMLFGLSSLDPAAFLGASGFLATVAMLAGYVPARRATKVDPMIALRYE